MSAGGNGGGMRQGGVYNDKSKPTVIRISNITAAKGECAT